MSPFPSLTMEAKLMSALFQSSLFSYPCHIAFSDLLYLMLIRLFSLDPHNDRYRIRNHNSLRNGSLVNAINFATNFE